MDKAARGNFKITGIVKDASTAEAVEFATVSIIDLATQKPIDGAITDSKGKFLITNIGPGRYQLAVSFIGYETTRLDLAEIKEDKGEINVGEIKLNTDAKVLDEIVVEDSRELIEDRIDRLVYNAEKDLTNAGGDATEVLRKVPLLSVDLDGNVQIRGNGNIRVLINNKPSSIMAGSVADALKQIPAEIIKSVEVITSPSARYDAEGTAGIINIITKKNTLQGLSGNLSLTGGLRGSNFSANANYRWNKAGLAFNSGGRLIYAPFEQSTNRQSFFEDFSTVINQDNEGRRNGIFGNTQLTFDYDLSKRSSLTAGARIGYRNFDSDNLLRSFTLNSSTNVESSFTRDFENENRNNSLDFNLDYLKTFAKPGRELSLLALYSRSLGDTFYELDQLNNNLVLDYRERNNNDSFNDELTFQADYVHPFTEGIKFETGVKTVLRNVGSDFQFFNFDFDNQLFVENSDRSDEFNYDQDVWSGYVSLTYALPRKYAVQVGMRYEKTEIAGNFVTQDTQFTQSYDNWIPNVILSKEFKKGQKLKVSYNRRIQRPSIFFLNPFINYADSLNISQGNPTLEPELTDNFELGYSLFSKKFSLNFSAYWQRTKDVITSVLENVSESVQLTTFQNVARSNNYGVSLFGSVNPIKAWRISGNVNVYYVDFDSPTVSNPNANIAYNFNLNSSLDFGKGWSAQFFGFFNSQRVQLQGLQGAFSFYSLGVKKQLFKEKGAVILSIANPFARSLSLRSSFEDDDFVTQDIREVFIRDVRLGFEYKFGKSQNQPRRRRSRRIESDAKQGESDNNR
ncbi:MAG: TonB-dependent receptor [Microscillaceae bacterium]|nr:TonB-dependent receptor [Microscillaceae bacterium]